MSLKHLSSRLPLVLSYLFLAVLPACGDGPSAPPAPVASLILSRDTATLVPGARLQISASPRDGQGTPLNRSITWASSDPQVATVAAGEVAAVAPGKVTISATAMSVTSKTEIVIKEGAVVGPQGSTFTVTNGAVTVNVPAGAVSAPAQIIVDSVPISAAVPRMVRGTVYSLQTAGTLSMPVSIGLRYDASKLSAGTLEKGLKIYSLIGDKWARADVSVVDTLADRVFASVGGSGTFAVFEAAPATATINVGNNQTAAVGSKVPLQPSIRVIDSEGFPVPDLAVEFTVTSGGGSITSGSTVTNSGGNATLGSWTLGTVAGSNTLTAVVARASGGPFVFAATGLAGPAKAIVFVTPPPATAQSTIAFSPQPAVQLKDEFGNPVPSAGIPVSAAVTAGAATLGGTKVQMTSAAGLATFVGLALTGNSGQKEITFSSGELPPLIAFVNVTGGSGAATQLFAGNNQIAVAGAPVQVLPAVRITDVAGDPVAGVSVFFNVTEGGGQISGAEAITDANGVARVGSWTLGKIAGTNTLRAVASGLPGSPVIISATGVPGSPASMVLMSGGNQSGPAGRGPRNYILFRVFDSNGNGVPDVTVNLSVTAGGGSIPASEKTLSTGVAVVHGWTFGKSAGVQRLQATVSTTPSISATVDATATTLRIVTFGDSNTDYGYIGNSSLINQVSYISANPQRPTPFVPNAFTQLAGKIESFWGAQYSPAIVAVNHAVLGTSSGTTRSTAGAPGARTVVNGITRFGGEVLGLGYPWNGAEPTGANFPGPIARVQAFTPTPDDFVYVSIGTNDGGQLITAQQTLDNLTWMIEAWESRGLPTDHFILTNLPPAPGQTQLEAERNRAIRTLGLTRGVRFIDISAYTSNDDGITWKSSSLHVGDGVHYSESVREWIAQQIISIMATATQPAL